jgi:hypothetical protein
MHPLSTCSYLAEQSALGGQPVGIGSGIADAVLPNVAETPAYAPNKVKPINEIRSSAFIRGFS